MKLAQVKDLAERMNEHRLRVFDGKSNDYATDEDALSNFKRLHQLCCILNVDTSRSAIDCGMYLFLLKVDRLNNLKMGKCVKNEPMRDTIMDAHNYLDLINSLIEEEDNEDEPDED
jgi:hypothetical protein